VSKSAHLRMFMLATLAWAGFWVAGLPSYYQQYSTAFMVWFEVILLLGLVGLVYCVLKRVSRQRRVAVACWIAFYFTMPLSIYDWLYCGVYLGHGMDFLWRFWYLTTYYVIPWPLLPGIAIILTRAETTGLGHVGRQP
jgi:hypothetical protein